MSESHVVSGLVSKRAEVAGQIVSFKAEIVRLQAALSHLDGAIKLFAPQFNLRDVKARRTNKRSRYFANGEAQRLALEVMRDAGAPLTSREISDRMLLTKGIEDVAASACVQKNVLLILSRHKGKLVRKCVSNKSGAMTWEIV